MKVNARAIVLLGVALAVLTQGPVLAGPKPEQRLSPQTAPVPPVLSASQVAEVAKFYVARLYDAGNLTPVRIRLGGGRRLDGFGQTLEATYGTGLRCFAYCFPQLLADWAAPHATAVSDINTPLYHGSGWQVHFVAPKRPGASANVIEIPGDDFDVIMTRTGHVLCVAQGYD